MTDETLQDVINDVDAFKKKSIEQVREKMVLLQSFKSTIK